MDDWIVGFNLFAVCLALALFEIQIEGPHGWAEKLPTWRLDKPWIRKLTNGKPITGYHVYLNIVILAFIHYPVVWSEWTWVAELRILSQYMIIAVYWDFLWFVANPHFGLRRFKRANIWWHHKWALGIMPLDYVMGTVVSAALWLAADGLEFGAAAYAPGGTTMTAWALLVGIVIGLTGLTAAIVELIPRRRPPAPTVPSP
jgi:hypothetical protein